MGDFVLHTTPYGRHAAALLRDRVAAAKAGDPLAPVSVVVPSNYVGVSIRRLLADGTLGAVTRGGVGIAGLTLLTIYRLAELLGAPRLAAQGRRPVSTPLVAAAVRRALADEAGLFASVREHPATEEALVHAYRELSEVRPGTLDLLAARCERSAEVVRICRAARALLVDDWFEEADLMAAAEAAVAEGSPVLGDLGTVLVYLPQELSLPAAGLVRSLSERRPVEVIAGRSGAADADADVDRTVRRLGLAAPAAQHPAPTATAVASVSDAEEEAREAVHRVVQAARRGTPLERIAVLYPTERPYGRLVAEQLEAADIAWNGRAVRPLADRLAGRWVLDLLTLPDRRYARPAVLGLCSAPIVDARGRRVATGAWERVSREAGIVRGRREWRTKLRWLAEDLRGRAALEDDDDAGREWLARRHRRTAEQAEALQEFTGELFAQLDRAAAASSWRELVPWATGVLHRYLGGERVRERWPEAERAAAERVEEALDRLAGLDHVGAPVDLRVFRRTLQLELDADLGRMGEFGQGVLVGPVSAGLGLDLDLVIVLGLAEGTMPTRPREDSLLPDRDRQAAGDELRLRTAQAATEHRHLLAALAASSGTRVLVFPRGDLRRSSERVASRWLLDSAEALGGTRSLPPDAPWHAPVASFAARVRTTTFPADRQEYGLRALAGARDADRSRLADHPLVAGDPMLRRGVELVQERGRAGRFSRFDGNIGALAARLPTPADGGRIVSPTSLEAWLACPHGYFMHHVLGVEPVENPEELLEIDALEKGSLVHDVLERWLREQLDGDLPAPTQPWPAAARQRLRALAIEACDAAEQRGVTGHRRLWQRDRKRLLGDFDRFLDADDTRRAVLGLTPIAAEHSFGMGDSTQAPVTVDLGDGRAVAVRGRIDRIDRRDGAGLVVCDYKTGGTSRYGDLREGQPLGDGTMLQLAVYGVAVLEQASARDGTRPDVRSEYWFVSSRGEFSRKGYEVTDAVVADLARAMRLATDGIAAGHFPLRPPEPAWRPFTVCRYCDPDELGTADRYREWERIRRTPALRDYVTYVEPEALEDSP